MRLILVDRSAIALDAVKGELTRRLGTSDTVAFFAAHGITHSFDDGPVPGPADIASALRWAAATHAGERRILLVSDLRNTPYDDNLAAAIRAVQEISPVDVLFLETPGYGYWVAERIASGRVMTASSPLELGKAMAALLDQTGELPMPGPVMGHSPASTPAHAAPAPRSGRRSGMLGAVTGAAAGMIGAVGAAIGRLGRRRIASRRIASRRTASRRTASRHTNRPTGG